MFQRLKLWLIGDSGLRQATRDAAREATREGLTEGFQLGVEDFLNGMAAIARREPVTIEATTNGHSEPLTAADLKGLRKAELLELASERGLEANAGWTVAQLTAELTR